jgi:hypothetical protein
MRPAQRGEKEPRNKAPRDDDAPRAAGREKVAQQSPA